MDHSLRFAFYTLEKTRANIARVVRAMNLSQLNTLAPGFNNTMAWNLGHVVVTTQILTYKIAGLDHSLDPDMVEKFKKGSSGNVTLTEQERDQLLELLEAGPAQLEADYKAGKFKQYEAYETSYGAKLSNIEEALQFVGTHEALHLGYLMAQRRALTE